MEIPGYEFRRKVTSLNPLALVLSFHVAVRCLLAKLLWQRMCAKCPGCNEYGQGCASQFGSCSTATGGIFGMCEALAGTGTVEAQQM